MKASVPTANAPTANKLIMFISEMNFYDEDMPIYALLIYGKNERANLTPEQRKAVKAFATAIKALRRRK